ncbi:vacuolar protein sorting-associated protein vps17 [Cordyceps militaris CM01]|uniref:Vacuolar protein sorting-associated protein 17 n=2 Tax=Cordyceps militaris TaxID=73501 RepID=G3JDY9_CORMM|nr:vacuolar protein sorting-associated protein vps17 [Cordyceps militaris CM01]ATY64639.1 vacuolar sorting-associated vps17 [Cordyceps militaris]EGX92814.1 vacuolar protein sorting-associated protein vps17 [Cordyceps militaris CM01]
MDYSASIHESDDPVGASPWGNSPTSSPKRNPPSFASLPQETSSSSFPFSSQDSNSLGSPALGADGFQRPGTATTASETEGETDHETVQGHEESEASQTIESQPAPPVQHHQLPQHSGLAPQGYESASIHGSIPPSEGQVHKPVQPQYRLQAKITGLERTGKKDPLLRFDIYTNLPRFRTSQYRDVRRLHSEFVKLAEHLISANPDAFVPAVPPAVTSAGAGTDEDETRVKALMQRWFNYVCNSEILMRDDEMILFVESDFGYSPLVKMKQPATGVRRKILKQFAPPPDDTPELADARPAVKLFYLGTMDAGHKVDKLVKARRGLGLAESDFGVKLGGMHVQEPHPGLANAYRKLGKVIQNVGDYHAAQATAEASTIGDPFQYHSQDAFIVKETLTNRQILTREFIQAQEATRSKLNAADRLKTSSSVRREKVDEAIAALDDARETEAYLYSKTHRVTQNLLQERRKWFSRTATDLRLSIREFVLREIEAERRTLSVLESVRADIRAIDASGGLSRLGREAHPVIRRTSLAASQGPKGDAWSGVPRRVDTANRSTSSSFMGKLPEDNEADDAPQDAAAGGRASLAGVTEEEDDDRIDARNAASRLATSTF